VSPWLQALLGGVVGLLVLWVALVLLLLWQARRVGDGIALREVLRLVPDVIRLLTRLVRDRDVPLRTRLLLVALLAYLLMPVDLVPDVIPVIGYADDAVVVALAIRLVVRRAGVGALERSWPGSEQGLSALLRLTGLGAR
jgi:uncharacterized membrane protein YkvA (DUF1232 family)